MKNKRKFNVLDVFIILFVVCLISFLAVRFTSIDKFKAGEGDIAEYEILVRDIKAVTAEAIPENGEIYDDTGVHLGTIIGKEMRNAEILLQTEDGTYDIVENDNKYDVTVKVTVSGVQKNEGFFFEGKKSYGVGSGVFVEAGNISFQGKVSKMDIIKK